jgi:hypothetical protein
MRPMAERMPRSRNTAANTDSLTSLKCVGVTPHSVHQSGRPANPCRSSTGRRSSGGEP